MPSNEPRDQLAADLMAYAWSDHGLRSAHNEHRFEATCAICTANVEAVSGAVTALGWRPPPRVIETAAELEEMPAGAIVMDSPYPEGDVYRRTADGVWEEPGFDAMTSSRVLALPVTVLWSPEEVGR